MPSLLVHGNSVVGETGGYKILPYGYVVNVNRSVANEKEGTRSSPTDGFW